jgi:hypothetical protein
MPTLYPAFLVSANETSTVLAQSPSAAAYMLYSEYRRKEKQRRLCHLESAHFVREIGRYSHLNGEYRREEACPEPED